MARHELVAAARRAGKTVSGRCQQRTATAVVIGLGMVAAGCGSAGSPEGQILLESATAIGSFHDNEPSGPSLLAALEPAVEALPTTAPSPNATAAPSTAASATTLQATATTKATAATSSTAPPTSPRPTTTTIPVTVEGAGAAPEGGHPPAPQAGMIPREHPYWDYPNCAPGPPWPSDCYPPSEWEIPQDLSDCRAGAYPDLGVGGICAGRRANERPRWTSDVARWASWCFRQPRGNCTWLLHQMKWSLDFLGAHPWCVLNEYQDRADAYGAGARGNTVKNRYGWHNCATVIDPLVKKTPAGRTNDAGLLLSDTVALAEQCRMVLPADVQLETRVRRSSERPERFGSDCDAWAEWAHTNPRGRDNPDCWRSARLAEEWMEHHHATPERYFTAGC